ncbi:hypothetical protein PLESTB_000822400 [Pleodorina starrii]|uniref:NAD-dependent epimerase/dehydratase domain-containing protein n=1 Tax=Pleodorina starrii TaxID=330485 RepID=A0A9W6F2K9_9CHLO|nr:hypothetical protein PLESTM_000137900 [Pleodorina starrii]GLC54087.1 hypothetical protein PLESTB_000822400 [Pleodorina starrii]GLC64608.1 hypothetical protein PLESTF_000184000 [Pleodorina starrii]
MTRVVLLGATGMVGQGVLREALLDTSVTSILSIGRRPCGKEDPKLKEAVLKDPSDLSSVKEELANVDACLYCLGVSAAGMSEKDYIAVTKDMTLRVFDSLLAQNPAVRFLYVSGDGADAGSSLMWARIKGETENALLARSPEGAFAFRPGLIEPRHGIKGQQSLLYKLLYAAAPALRGLRLPVTDTQAVGRAMLALAKRGSDKKILNNADINRLAAAASRRRQRARDGK